jgi:hypothetical protein
MDTTSVRYVNADAAGKFAEFDLKLDKLPRARPDPGQGRCLPSPGGPGATTGSPVPTVLAVTGYLPPEALDRF